MNTEDFIIRNGDSTRGYAQITSAVSALGLVLQNKDSRPQREHLIIVARHLVAIDILTGSASVTDSYTRRQAVIPAGSILSNANDRDAARWLARGGLHSDTYVDDIDDLSSNNVNEIEQQVMASNRFAKVWKFVDIRNKLIDFIKTEINQSVMAGGTGLSLDEIRSTYANRLFPAREVEDWIHDANYKNSDAAKQIKLIEKAWSEKLSKAKTDPEEMGRVKEFLKAELGPSEGQA